MAKRMLVTGGAGFIGSHVVDLLVAEGHEVVVVDNLSTGSRDNLNPAADFHMLDITSPDVERLLDEVRPDVICHNAAQISVSRAQASPLIDLNVNVAGGLRLIEFARRTGCRFVHASSAAVYGEPARIPVVEDAETRPINNYGVSKLAFEHYLDAFARTYGLSYAALRYANVYGPRQNAAGEAGVVAIFCEAIARASEVTIDGDGLQTRDFVYVEDVARANAAAARASARGVYNIGTGVETSIRQLLEAIGRAFGRRVSTSTGPARVGDIRKSVLDPGRAKADLGWRAEVDLGVGVEATVRWFMSHSPAV
jgi:UDP-glucose 4-epimerase